MPKEIHDGLRLYTGRTLDETIELYELEIKEISKATHNLEKCFPDYPTLPDARGTIRHYKKIVKWLKELKVLKEKDNDI